MDQTVKKKKPCCNKHHKAKWADGALRTEYQKEYPGKEAPMERTMPILPQGGGFPVDSKARFDGGTTYGQNYHPMEASRREIMRPRNTTREAAPFAGASTYTQDFPLKETAPYVKGKKPANATDYATGPFVGLTSHKEDFPDWGTPQPAVMVQHRGNNIPKGAGPFDGTSLYKDTFKKWPADRAHPIMPAKDGTAFPTGAFDDSTMYRNSYTPKGVAPAHLIRPAASALAQAGWYEGVVPSTEYNKQYIDKDGKPAIAARNTVGASGNIFNKGAFDGATSYGKDYRPMSAQAVTKAMRPQDINHEKHPFAGHSTYHNDFIQKESNYLRAKPKNTYEPSKDKFEDGTTHKANFKDWGTQPVMRGGPNYGSSIGQAGKPFEGVSSYKHDFTKMQGAGRLAAARPTSASRDLYGKGAFDGSTTYHADFVQMPLSPTKGYGPHACECDSASDCED